jgi:hypothetical protein
VGVQNLVLLSQVVNDELLLLVHPPGNGDEQQPERVQGFGHLGNLPCLNTCATGPQPDLCFQQDSVFGHYGNNHDVKGLFSTGLIEICNLNRHVLLGGGVEDGYNRGARLQLLPRKHNCG